MDRQERVAQLLYVARELGQKLVRELGGIPPFGVAVFEDGSEEGFLLTFYPRGQHPGAEFPELVHFVENEMRRRAEAGAVAVAMVTEVASGNERAMAVQIEGRSGEHFLMLYKYVKGLLGLNWSEGVSVGPTLFGSIYPSVTN
ncbi:MAG: hypothetical protein HY901_29900 [Deltaproteobacteria bacterium]|nr:hypothetical protein [Deltaproteobacteria bacterium]